MASLSFSDDTNARSQVQADEKPNRRARASQDGWTTIREEFRGQVCVACASGDQLELHHVVPRSQGGDDVVENLVVICRTCHTKLEAHEPRWVFIAAAIRRYVWQDAARLKYALDTVGMDRLNARYPELPQAEVADTFSEDFHRIMDTEPLPDSSMRWDRMREARS